jgi:hypothetical protein
MRAVSSLIPPFFVTRRFFLFKQEWENRFKAMIVSILHDARLSGIAMDTPSPVDCYYRGGHLKFGWVARVRVAVHSLHGIFGATAMVRLIPEPPNGTGSSTETEFPARNCEESIRLKDRLVEFYRGELAEPG